MFRRAGSGVRFRGARPGRRPEPVAVPDPWLHLHAGGVEPDHVVGVGLTAAPARERGSGLHRQRPVAGAPAKLDRISSTWAGEMLPSFQRAGLVVFSPSTASSSSARNGFSSSVTIDR